MQYVFALFHRKDEAASRPKAEFVPKTLADLHVEGISDGLNGAPPLPPPSTGQYGRAPWHASRYNCMHASQTIGDALLIQCHGVMDRRPVSSWSQVFIVWCSVDVLSPLKAVGLFNVYFFQE